MLTTGTFQQWTANISRTVFCRLVLSPVILLPMDLALIKENFKAYNCASVVPIGFGVMNIFENTEKYEGLLSSKSHTCRKTPTDECIKLSTPLVDPLGFPRLLFQNLETVDEFTFVLLSTFGSKFIDHILYIFAKQLGLK